MRNDIKKGNIWAYREFVIATAKSHFWFAGVMGPRPTNPFRSCLQLIGFTKEHCSDLFFDYSKVRLLLFN